MIQRKMINLHTSNQSISLFIGFNKNQFNVSLIGFIINILLIINYSIECDAAAVTTGSCFAKRLDSGNCIGIMEESISQSECCKRGGFYLNRQITQQEYLTDHLLFESGTPNCVQACNEELPSTCKGYICPEGHYCRMINNEPKCKCRLQCNTGDYLTGPLCTTNLRRFHNQCHLKQARCKSPKESLEVIPCPDEGLHCSQLSILSNDNINFNSIIKKFYTNYALNTNNLPLSITSTTDDSMITTPSSSSASSSSSSISSLNDKQQYRNIEINKNLLLMNHKASNDMKNYLISNIDNINDELIYDEKTLDTTNNELSKELICNTNEYCLLRQFDGRPSCEYWSDESWQTLFNCPETTFHEPMCSTDNQTYYNSCSLKLAGLKNQLEVRIAYKGECRSKVTCSDVECPRPGMRCSPHHLTGQPICMDCAKLPLDCNASFRNGQETLTLTSSSIGITNKRKTQVFGDPVWNIPVQTYGWPVVCGSNGKTYRNTCFLHVVNCLSDKFVELKKPEFCSETMPSLIDDWDRSFTRLTDLL
ncbi:Follistatin [Schistosoma japonicum]|uniref:Follistatin n=1 Tax=Schistosoma japonicum TaxID=6182 RepID=A0A4Z2CWS2_SCHJA|nr:Follistatin [Schistosoma japonicum]